MTADTVAKELCTVFFDVIIPRKLKDPANSETFAILIWKTGVNSFKVTVLKKEWDAMSSIFIQRAKSL